MTMEGIEPRRLSFGVIDDSSIIGNVAGDGTSGGLDNDVACNHHNVIMKYSI